MCLVWRLIGENLDDGTSDLTSERSFFPSVFHSIPRVSFDRSMVGDMLRYQIAVAKCRFHENLGKKKIAANHRIKTPTGGLVREYQWSPAWQRKRAACDLQDTRRRGLGFWICFEFFENRESEMFCSQISKQSKTFARFR